MVLIFLEMLERYEPDSLVVRGVQHAQRDGERAFDRVHLAIIPYFRNGCKG